MSSASELAERVRAQLPPARVDLEQLVRIPSISAAVERTADVRVAADQVAQWAAAAGAADTQLVDAGGAPAVVAR